MGSRWYASEAAARRVHSFPIVELHEIDGRWMLGMARPDDEVELPMPWRDVTGRSAAHIDRLARDWIAHGVAPCADGSRGVAGARPRCSGPGCRPGVHHWRHEARCAVWRWRRAEARARRVVSR